LSEVKAAWEFSHYSSEELAILSLRRSPCGFQND